MAFTVFISHKTEDSRAVAAVADRLKANEVAVYLDSFDPDAKDGPDLAEYLRDRMKNCHGLMAVVTERTIQSWWVPWEIGVASERDMPMSTFSYDHSAVPSYLRKWPYMTQISQLDEYAQTARRMVQERRTLIEKREVSGATEAVSGRRFNRALKAALGQ